MKVTDINGTTREVKELFPDPDYPGYMKVQFRRHHEWWSIAEFLEKNPTLTDLAKNAKKVAKDIVGVVTSSTTLSLSDTTQQWVEDDYLGFFVWISRGKGEGQKRTVIKNSRSKLTIDKAWDIRPDKSSQFVLSHNIQEVHAMGNTLPSDDIKKLERIAAERDISRGRINKDLKYIEVSDPAN